MCTLAPESLPFPGRYSLLQPALGCQLEALTLHPHQMRMRLPGNWPPFTDKIKYMGKAVQNQNEHSAADVHSRIHCMS